MSEPAARPRSLPFGGRFTILTALGGIAAVSWLYTWLQIRAMTGMEDMAMPAAFAPWTASDALLTIAIWWIMMLGMMLPSAAPMVIMFAAVNRSRRTRGQAFVPTAAFASGYAIAWSGFGLPPPWRSGGSNRPR